MLKKVWALLICLSLPFLATATTATSPSTTPPPAPKSPWTGQANLGLIRNTGNTRSANYNGAVTIGYAKNTWENTLKLSGQLNNSDGIRSAEKYMLDYETQYGFGKDIKFNFLFGRLNYTDDKFDPYTYVISDAVGMGRRILNNGAMTLDIKAGPGSRHNKEEATGIRKDELIFYTGATYKWAITNATSFGEDINIQIGHPNVYSKSETTLTTKIIGDLGLQVSYVVEHNSYIPPESTSTAKTDTTTNLSLVYTFW